MFKIGQHIRLVLILADREKVNLPSFAKAHHLCQNGALGTIRREHLHFFARARCGRGHHLIQPFGSLAQEAAHRLVREQDNTGLVRDDHRQAQTLGPASRGTAVDKLFQPP